MDDFGHRPHPNPLLRRYCARCRTRVRTTWVTEHDTVRYSTETHPVPWPCTSALILGIAPRPDPAQSSE